METHKPLKSQGEAKMHTTLRKISRHFIHPFQSNEWATLLGYLNKTEIDDEPLSFVTLLNVGGFDATLNLCQTAPEYDKQWRLFAVWCARRIQHLM